MNQRKGSIFLFLMAAGLTVLLIVALRPDSAEAAKPEYFMNHSDLEASRSAAVPDREAYSRGAQAAGRRVMLAGWAMSSQEKERLERKWRSMTPRQRQQFRQRMKKFNRLPARDRELIRRRHDQLRQMSPTDRRRLQRELNRWDKLSPSERQDIRRRFLDRQPQPGSPNRQNSPASGGS